MNGLDRHTAEQMVADDTPPPLVLPACLRPVIDLFVAVAGQWRMAAAGMAGAMPVALDLTAVRHAAEALAIDWTEELLRDLQVMERAALVCMKKARP